MQRTDPVAAPAVAAPAVAAGRRRGHPGALLLDCDGVLLDWLEGFRVHAEARLGREIRGAGPAQFDLAAWLGVDTADRALELVREFNAGDRGMFGRLDPLPGAVDAISGFAAAGREMHILTACSLDPGVVEMRRSNLAEVFGDVFSEIHCLGLRARKDPLLQEYAAATWVEDRLENALAGVRAGHASYLIRASHNIAREPSTRVAGLRWVDGWSDIRALETAR